MKSTSKMTHLAAVILSLLATTFQAQAQITANATTTNTEVNSVAQQSYASEKGHWDVYTDYKQLNTTVRFYNPQNQLIHQENFPGEYIKLTIKNTKVFDRILKQLQTKSPVQSQIKTLPMIPEHQTEYTGKVRNEAGNTNSELLVSAFPVMEGKIKVVLKNPSQEKVTIQLEDQEGNLLMKEQTKLDGYYLSLVVNSLPEGIYQLTVQGKEKKYVRPLMIKQLPARPSVVFLEEIAQ